ncbi:S-layer homology domain-containing protein [Paenibacillus sp.]|uniref:S-layer homology domain-containing protein n=1 Tax=Paenibacillus sp. TaxID=58172 RepID=UPI002D24FFC1|nr:S-layer homology domain-containing protein [Paenibacillus sp.]HZG87373.1 S-layer homology domain-containing protein [Paenibacillus sp.]
MKKGLSLLLAASVAFSAFSATAFAATPQTAEEKYQALVEAGIFEGFPDGQAHLDQNMTRAQAAKIVALLLGLDQDASAASVYKDLKDAEWAAGYIGAATKAGILEGRGNGVFDPSANVTIQELAKIIVEALDLDVDASATVAGTDPWAAPYVAAAIEAGLIAEQDDYTAPASREILVESSYSAYAVIGEEDEVVAAATATPVGAKKIEVKFGAAIDESKATFTVKKGTISLNVASKSVSEDKKTVTLELSSKLSEGEYTVTVGGVSATDLTSSFTAENEKVAKIEFKATNAPLTELDSDGIDDLAIPYVVSNQYGEDITKTTSLTTNIGTVNASAKQVEITGNYKLNDVVAVTLIHPSTATSAVQQFTVVAQARVGDVAITGLYNKDNKSLDEDTNLGTDAFYLVVEAKDQYGNPVSNLTRLESDLVLSQSNNTVVDVRDITSGGTTYADFETLSIDGVDKTVVRIDAPAAGIKVGQNNVTLISNTTGKNASFNITVSEAARADTINLISPGSVYVGEKAYVAVEVFDKQGNAITNLSTLNHATKGVKVNVNGDLTNAFVEKDGIVQIEIPASKFTAKGYVTVMAQTSSYNIKTLTLEVKDAAVPTLIRGVDADFAKAYKAGKTGVTLTYTNLAIEDQYGRVMADADVKAWLDADTDRKIEVAQQYAAGNSNDVIVLGGATSIVSNGTTVSTVTFDTTGKGSEKLTLTLHGDNGAAISSSAADVTLRVTDGTEYVSYSVDSIGTVYDEAGASKTNAAAYDKAVKVYGVLGDGNKVQLDVGTEYTVSALTNATVNGDVYDSTLNIASSPVSYGDKTEVVVPVTVVISKTGEKLAQDVTISKVAPKVASVKFVESGKGKDGTAKTTLSISSNSFNVADILNGATYDVWAKDQYGASKQTAANGHVTFDDGTAITTVAIRVAPVTGSVTITGNGTASAAVTGIEQYEAFDVTLEYADGVTATVRVTRTN